MSSSASSESSRSNSVAGSDTREVRRSMLLRELPSLEEEPVVVLPSRLLPQTTLRGLIVLTLLAAVLAAVARRAGDGGVIASSLLVGFAFIAIVMMAGTVVFMVGWIVGNLHYTADRSMDADRSMGGKRSDAAAGSRGS